MKTIEPIKTIVTMDSDGDVYVIGNGKRLLHVSYDVGDDLEENLRFAYWFSIYAMYRYPWEFAVKYAKQRLKLDGCKGRFAK